MDKAVCFGGIGRCHFNRVPDDFSTDSVGNVPEVICFGERAAVIEMAGGGSAGFAGIDPFFMMADAVRDGWLRRFEFFELLFRQQNVLAVIGQKHSLAADEEGAAIPLRNQTAMPKLGLVFALIPGDA